MANVICRGKTDAEIVRHIIVTEPLVLDQRFGKIQREFIARRANREQGRVILAVCTAPGVRKGATEAGQIGFPGAVIRIAEQVGRLGVEQLPLGIAIPGGKILLVPLVHPIGIALEVIGAGYKLPAGF